MWLLAYISKKFSALKSVMIVRAKDRSEFTKHFNRRRTHLKLKNTWCILKHFLFKYFKRAIECYPFFDTEGFKTKLDVLYYRDDSRILLLV